MEQVSRNFSPRNRELAIYTQAAILILISAILITLDRLGTVGAFRKIAAYPLEYVQIPVIAAKTNILSKSELLINLAKIEQENATLAQKLAEVSAENARLQTLAAENEALRTHLGLFGTQIVATPAKVLGTSRFLIILPEKPAKAGSVVTLGGNFVGVVVEAGPKLAKVRLPSDPAANIPATAITPSGPVYAALAGRYGKTQVLEKVEKTEIVPIGSIIQTTGEESILPGLVLGKVVRVEKNDAAPFLDIEVESLLDFSKLSTVFVLGE